MWRSCRRRDSDSRVLLTGEQKEALFGETLVDGNNADGEDWEELGG